MLDIDIEELEVGNTYPLKHEILGIDTTIRITEKSISIENPETTSITLGKKLKTIKEYQLDMKKSVTTNAETFNIKLQTNEETAINLENKIRELEARIKLLEGDGEEDEGNGEEGGEDNGES